MKTACVLITHLPVKAEVQRRPELRSKPVIITSGSEQGALVLDFSSQVKGVTAGMPLQEAMSRCHGATLLEADETHYLKVFHGIVNALLQRSPIVEEGEMGCAFVGVHGLESLYRGEAGVVAALLNAAPHEFNPRVGLAGAKFPAYVAAMRSEGGRAVTVPEDVPSFLRGISIDLLPMSWENRTRLHRFGLHTMGQVASLSVGSIQAQFGTEGRIAWELANGIDRSWVTSVKREEVVRESLTFPVPATNLYTILPALETLLGRAFTRPSISGKGVRSVSIVSNILGRAPWVRKFVFKNPVNTKERALFALKGLLDTVKLPGALEDMAITLSGITGESGIQFSLFADVRKREQLRETMRQLELRLRTKPPVYKVMEVEPWSRIPERRQALVQFTP